MTSAVSDRSPTRAAVLDLGERLLLQARANALSQTQAWRQALQETAAACASASVDLTLDPAVSEAACERTAREAAACEYARCVRIAADAAQARSQVLAESLKALEQEAGVEREAVKSAKKQLEGLPAHEKQRLQGLAQQLKSEQETALARERAYLEKKRLSTVIAWSSVGAGAASLLTGWYAASSQGMSVSVLLCGLVAVIGLLVVPGYQAKETFAAWQIRRAEMREVAVRSRADTASASDEFKEEKARLGADIARASDHLNRIGAAIASLSKTGEPPA